MICSSDVMNMDYTQCRHGRGYRRWKHGVSSPITPWRRRKETNTSRSIIASSRCSNLSFSLLLAIFILQLLLPTALAQQCIDLTGSTTCPAFTASQIDPNLTGLFPFLSYVTDVRSFDTQLAQYVSSSYAQQKYQSRDFFGCSNVNIANATNLYARFTYSFICNAIIQNSIRTCGTSTQGSRALCADSCSDFALSEDTILSSPELCGQTGPNAISQLRADFTNCAQPEDALNTTCVPGSLNEPENCGFQNNLVGLCTFCNTSSTVNSTNYCCKTSNTEERCSNVHLPIYSSMQPLSFSTTSAPSPTMGPGSSVGSSNKPGLSAGQIAGIVIGAVIGAAVLLALLICCCLLIRRRQGTGAKASLNQPTPALQREKPRSNEFAAVPGARVTRMTAIEHDSNISPGEGTETRSSVPEHGELGAVGPARSGKREKSSSEGLDESSPESQGYTSGDGAATGHSEQLESFKDYYSNDEIHPGDMVSTLWAYAPRANDEFELERGDMLRIVGIWDDGWATGVRLHQRAEQWEPERSTQRDSGMSSGTAQEPAPQNGDVKAFPLVCVCLPQHWRKTIEGDITEPDLTEGTTSE